MVMNKRLRSDQNGFEFSVLGAPPTMTIKPDRVTVDGTLSGVGTDGVTFGSGGDGTLHVGAVGTGGNKAGIGNSNLDLEDSYAIGISPTGAMTLNSGLNESILLAHGGVDYAIFHHNGMARFGDTATPRGAVDVGGQLYVRDAAVFDSNVEVANGSTLLLDGVAISMTNASSQRFDVTNGGTVDVKTKVWQGSTSAGPGGSATLTAATHGLGSGILSMRGCIMNRYFLHNSLAGGLEFDCAVDGSNNFNVTTGAGYSGNNSFTIIIEYT